MINTEDEYVEESPTPEQEKIADLQEEVHDLKMAMKELGELVLPILDAWYEDLGTTDELIDQNSEEIRAFLDPDYCPPEQP